MGAEEYHELSYYTLAHGDPSFIHQYVVDAYTAQCASESSKPIAIVFALIGLYLAVEENRSGKDVQRIHMRLAKKRREWPRFALPQRRGTITVSDVLAAPAGAERDDMIRQWCASVWAAWAESHAEVRALLREALPP
ncbi:MAG TPA: DUF5946 family protein [Xanthobacteraceae bacterium]|nr:DUF5946 family protein [Xanthobacteraceae bacterium]